MRSHPAIYTLEANHISLHMFDDDFGIGTVLAVGLRVPSREHGTGEDDEDGVMDVQQFVGLVLFYVAVLDEQYELVELEAAEEGSTM